MRSRTRAAVVVWCALLGAAVPVFFSPGCGRSATVRSTDIQGASALAAIASLVRNSQAYPTAPIARAVRLPGLENLVLGFLGRVPLAHAALPGCPTLTNPNPSAPPATACNGKGQIVLHFPGINEAGGTAPDPNDPTALLSFIEKNGCSYAYDGAPTPTAIWFSGDNTLNFSDCAVC